MYCIYIKNIFLLLFPISDACALASSIREMTAATQKMRTALWCALQMALAFQPMQAHDKNKMNDFP